PTILKLVLLPSSPSATTMTTFGFIEFVPLFVNLVLPSIRKDLSGSQGSDYGAQVFDQIGVGRERESVAQV
ncbi:hypothetical protein ACKFKG_04645, partial [Phormidesmis sp. 146-35]